MFIEELDIAIIDPPGNLLADLMGTPPLNHIEPRPSILRLRARRGPNEQVVLELALEAILLDVVG
jgi:hypothetical protein